MMFVTNFCLQISFGDGLFAFGMHIRLLSVGLSVYHHLMKIFSRLFCLMMRFYFRFLWEKKEMCFTSSLDEKSSGHLSTSDHIQVSLLVYIFSSLSHFRVVAIFSSPLYVSIAMLHSFQVFLFL